MTLNIALRVALGFGIVTKFDLRQLIRAWIIVFLCWYVFSRCDLHFWPVDFKSSWYVKRHVIEVCTEYWTILSNSYSESHGLQECKIENIVSFSEGQHAIGGSEFHGVSLHILRYQQSTCANSPASSGRMFCRAYKSSSQSSSCFALFSRLWTPWRPCIFWTYSSRSDQRSFRYNWNTDKLNIVGHPEHFIAHFSYLQWRSRGRKGPTCPQLQSA